MYNIYFGERLLIIANKGINNSSNVYSYDKIDNLKQFVIDFDQISIDNSLIIEAENPDIVFNQLILQIKYIEAAGGVVKNNKNEILFIYRNDKWDLPKGKCELNECIDTCALREVGEECGISGHTISKKIHSTFHTYYEKEELCLKQTYWYEMNYYGSEQLTPQIEEGISKAVWINKEEIDKCLNNTYQSVKSIVSSI